MAQDQKYELKKESLKGVKNHTQGQRRFGSFVTVKGGHARKTPGSRLGHWVGRKINSISKIPMNNIRC